MGKTDLILVGAGGHALSCLDVIEAIGRYRIAGFVGRPEEIGQRCLGYDVIASDSDLPRLVRECSQAHIAVGQIKTPAIRIRLYQYLKELGFSLPTVISPRAYVSSHAFVDEGTIVMHDALVNAGARIGVNCIINTKALVEHGAEIGDHCHMSTCSVVNGDATIGTGTFIGSGSIVREGISIGQECLVGMGLMVRSDLAGNTHFTGYEK